MNKVLILIPFLVSALIAASAEKNPEFISFLGLNPTISADFVEGGTKRFFSGFQPAVDCYFIGHENATVREQSLIQIGCRTQELCSNLDSAKRILKSVRSDFIEQLSNEALTKPAQLFVAALFLRCRSSAMEEVDFNYLESTRYGESECSGRIKLAGPRTSTFYVARERIKAGESVPVYALVGHYFQGEEHVQQLIKRVKSGEATDPLLLREAFTDFLIRHDSFGCEIDHNQLRRYFEELQQAKKLKAKL